MEIKTIKESDAATFDRKANTLFAEGWKPMHVQALKEDGFTTFVLVFHRGA